MCAASSPSVVLLVLVIGLPAAGKTTFLSHLQQHLRHGVHNAPTPLSSSSCLLPEERPHFEFIECGPRGETSTTPENHTKTASIRFSSVDICSLDEMMRTIASGSPFTHQQHIPAEGTPSRTPKSAQKAVEKEVEELGNQKRKSHPRTEEDIKTATTASVPPRFTPQLWKEASEQLFAAVQRRLHVHVGLPSPSSSSPLPASSFSSVFDASSSVSSSGLAKESTSGPSPLSVKLVLVEDNMPLRSMRERYWKLCRDIERQLHEKGDVEPPSQERGEHTRSTKHKETAVAEEEGTPVLQSSAPPLLLELRIHAPLGVCMARNEARWQKDSTVCVDSPYANPTRSMHCGPSLVPATAERGSLPLSHPSRNGKGSGVKEKGENAKEEEEETCYRIPPTVIESLFHSFEHCYPPPLPSSASAGASTEDMDGGDLTGRIEKKNPDSTSPATHRRCRRHMDSCSTSRFLLYASSPSTSSPVSSVLHDAEGTKAAVAVGEGLLSRACVGGYEWMVTTSEWLVLQQFQGEPLPPSSISSLGKEGNVMDSTTRHIQVRCGRSSVPHRRPDAPGVVKSVSISPYSHLSREAWEAEGPSWLAWLFLHKVIPDCDTWKRLQAQRRRMRVLRQAHEEWKKREEQRRVELATRLARVSLSEDPYHYPSSLIFPLPSMDGMKEEVKECFRSQRERKLHAMQQEENENKMPLLFSCKPSCPELFHHFDQHIRQVVRKEWMQQSGITHRCGTLPPAARPQREIQKRVQQLKQHTLQRFKAAIQANRVPNQQRPTVDPASYSSSSSERMCGGDPLGPGKGWNAVNTEEENTVSDHKHAVETDKEKGVEYMDRGFTMWVEEVFIQALRGEIRKLLRDNAS